MAPMKKPPSKTYQQLTEAVSLGTVARRTGLPRRHVRRLIQQGKLPFVQVRGQIRVPRSEVLKLGDGVGREARRHMATRPMPSPGRSPS